MKLRRPVVLLAILAAIALSLASPALADGRLTLQALGAQTTAGNGAGIDVGLARTFFAVVRVTAGSGTVTTFDVWLECSIDGTNFTECAVDDRVKATTTGAGPHTDNVIKVVAETAVTTSAVYSAKVSPDTAVQVIRARWNIVGTTPSETFEVLLNTK